MKSRSDIVCFSKNKNCVRRVNHSLFGLSTRRKVSSQKRGRFSGRAFVRFFVSMFLENKVWIKSLKVDFSLKTTYNEIKTTGKKLLRGAIMYYPPYQQMPQQDLRNYRRPTLSYEQYEEKNQIKKCASKIGLTMIGNRFFYLLFSSFSSIFLIWIGLMSVDPTNGHMEYDLTGLTLFSMIIYSVCFFFPFLILARAENESMNRLFPFEKVGGKTTFLLVLVGMGICMSLNLQTSMMLTLGEIVGIHIPLPESPFENTTPYIVVSVLTTALLPALLEEFAFRGVILGSLRRFGDGFAVIISALLFGMTHFYLTQIPMAFILGLVMGFIVVKTNSLLPGILIHFFNNFFAAGIDALSYNISTGQYILVFYAATYLLMGIGILCVWRLSKSSQNLVSFPERAKSGFSLKKRVGFFCSSGVMISAFVLFGLCIILGTVGVL